MVEQMDMTPVAAHEVEDIQFVSRTITAIWQHGYDEGEVDDFLDRVWWTLKRQETTRTMAAGLAELGIRDATKVTKADLTDTLRRILEVLEWETTVETTSAATTTTT